jgi:hypothetical protein
MLQVIRLAAGEGQCPSPESKDSSSLVAQEGGFVSHEKVFSRAEIREAPKALRMLSDRITRFSATFLSCPVKQHSQVDPHV